MYKSAQNLNKDTFKAEFETENGNVISVSVFPPSMNIIRKLTKLENDDVDGTIEVISEIISKNRENRKFTADETGDLLDVFDVSDFLTDFTEWMSNVKKK